MDIKTQKKYDDIQINDFEDIITARKIVREILIEYNFSLLDQTKIVTAVSELARNILTHAGNGFMNIFTIYNGDLLGVRCVFYDKGPGIENIDQALVPGFSTSGSLGLGLGGAKKLSDNFNIKSDLGIGTTIELIKWNRKNKL